MEYQGFKEIHYQSADELWEALSPTRELVKTNGKLIYRGQGAASWKLVPSVLRYPNICNADAFWGELTAAEKQVFIEARLLEIFAEQCDRIGIKIPGDSPIFREEVLTTEGLDAYLRNPSLWPNPALDEVMAFAQHHGVATRLLDWTRRPYVAAYFAASSALSNLRKNGESDACLALWVLNDENIAHYPSVRLVNIPGGISPHLAAQSGLFTAHTQIGMRGQPLEVNGLEHEFSKGPGTPLLKLTLPVQHSARL